jgi:hypothetical protein
MKFKVLLLIILSLFTTNILAQNLADSLYEIAWNNFNEEKYSEAALLFEAAIDAGKDMAVIHLNAASSWAYANNKEKTFEHLFKMVNGGYLDKEFVLIWFSEFYKYHDLKQWNELMELFDLKRNELYQYAFKSEFQVLEKEKMYSDFDSLVKNLIAISPHLKIREKVCNMDYKSLFKNLRNELEKCNSVDTFALILYRTLISCQDGHTSLTSLNPFEYLSNGENLEFCASIAKYELLFNSVIITSVNLPQLVYHQGKYFVSENYKYNEFNIPEKTELIKVNNLRPQEYIRLNIDRKRSLSWDFENDWFFSETFLQQDIASDTVVELTFKLRNELISFPVKLDIGYTPKKITTVENGFVWYWAEKQILYIRMPRMVNSAYYVSEIQNHADKTINKVIIDIRQNPGGSDYDWEDVLNVITPLNLNIKVDYAYTNYFIENDKELKEYPKMPELGLVYKTVERNIGVGENENINYSGNIYILYDNSTFSAAGSLVNACYYSDKLISVGQSTGRILGFGTDPKNFQLPNSKLNYRIAPVLDITNIQDYQDIFHDSPELNVNLSLVEKIILKSNPYTIEYLKTKDPYVNRILQSEL